MPADTTLFRDIGLVFAAIVVGSAIAAFARQPLFVGYVIGGLLVSPFTPGPAVRDVATFELFAQIGVVLLMFSIGIEFSLHDLTRFGAPATVGAPATMALVIGVTMLAGLALGWGAPQAAAVGIVLSVASTMVAVKLFVERGEIRTPHARLTMATTLAEDLLTVALIVLLPVLAGAAAGEASSIIVALGRAVLVLVPFFILANRVVPPLLERVARRNSTELFLIVAMAVAIGTAALSSALGLSLAVGAFLAGLVISESEFTHEILARVLPLRDVFVALFFASIGMLVRPAGLFADIPTLLVVLGLIILGKFVLRTAVLRTFRYPTAAAALVSVHLAQIGEFSFVLAQAARAVGLLGETLYNTVLGASLVSILATALMSGLAHRLIEEPAHPVRPVAGRSPRLSHHVIICGFGRIGGRIGEALGVAEIPFVAVDLDFRVIEHARVRGIPTVFGDAAGEPVLRHAGAEDARLAVVAIPDFARARLAVRRLKALNPDLPVLVRAHHPDERGPLLAEGALEVIQPEHEAAVTLTRHALQFLGVPWDRVKKRLIATPPPDDHPPDSQPI